MQEMKIEELTDAASVSFPAAGDPQREEQERIERSLIKKFRKPIWRKFTKGI